MTVTKSDTKYDQFLLENGPVSLMVFDTIVIGAGTMGSSAAYWLSKTQDILLIEQFSLLHTRGSSHGQSRIIRKTYREPYYADMMKEAYELWYEIERESGKSLYRKTGGLDFGREGNSDLRTTLNTCVKTGLNHEILDARQLQERFPAYQVDSSYYGIFQPDTGIINATKSVNTFQTLAAKNGTQIVQEQPVVSINSKNNTIHVRTKTDDFVSNSLVVTPGSWINTVLALFDIELAIKVWKLTFAYYKTFNPKLYQAGVFPVFIAWDDEQTNYGFPINERENFVKIAPHYSDLIEKSDVKIGDNRPNQQLLASVSEYVGNTFKEIDTGPQFVETCYYTMTGSENFLIDYLPQNPNVVVAGGFSGHGFKFTPIIGKIIFEMITNEHTDWDLDQFKIRNYLK